jgi:hypothetical protein
MDEIRYDGARDVAAPGDQRAPPGSGGVQFLHALQDALAGFTADVRVIASTFGNGDYREVEVPGDSFSLAAM